VNLWNSLSGLLPWTKKGRRW